MRRSVRSVRSAWSLWCVAAAVAVTLGGCSAGNVFELAVGDCFDDASGTEGEQFADVPVVDCEEPHDREVFHAFEVPDGDHPGGEALRAAAEEDCIPAFEAYVGVDYGASSLRILPIVPTEESWETGDREVLCALHDREPTELVGSMRDAGV